MEPVENIKPVNGWVMMWEEYDHGNDRAPTISYRAVHPELGTKIFQTSSYGFSPTQARFEWLLEHGQQMKKTPKSVGYRGFIHVPWTNLDIDQEIMTAKRN